VLGESQLEQHSDEALLGQVAGRDATALEALYDRHAQIVYNLIVRIVQDTAIADELLQETFWQVWQQAGAYRGEGTVAAWLYRIARNKSLDQLRRQKARPQPVETETEEAEVALWAQLPAEEAEVELSVEHGQAYQSVRQALQQIPSEQRNYLELAYFEGMSQRQIAEYTKTPLGTVKTRLRMGLEKLERLLGGAGYRRKDV
jgi:RNA polymerase sigma-70 factor (ECF subfamily)